MSSFVVGVAFAGIGSADNIGFVIPIQVVNLFLDQYEKFGKFLGLSTLGVSFQSTENPALRTYHKLDLASRNGVIISKISPLSSLMGIAEVGDIVLAIDGLNVAEDTTVLFRDMERLSFRQILTSKVPGADVQLLLQRKGRALSVQGTLQAHQPLVPRLDGYDAAPEYLIVGGLVFMNLSVPWLQRRYRLRSITEHSAPASLVKFISTPRESDVESIVIVAKVRFYHAYAYAQ
jgi:hypothetical protein